MLFFRKTYDFDICKNRLTEAILTYTKHIIHKKIQKYPNIHALDGSISSFFITAKSFVTNSVMIRRVH